ncbi:MAG: kelch repeat-containing protein [Bryobacteraceae bacterium]
MRRVIVTLLLTTCSVPGQGVWERRADYPLSATEVSAAAIDRRVYAVCGLTDSGSTSNLYIYDTVTDTWTTGAPAPIAGGADHCNVAAANGRLYLLGAIRIGSGFVDGNTYEYNPGTDRWTTVARMTIPRGASGVASDGRRIFVAGGLAPNSSVPSFEVFDTETKQWTPLPSMPTPRDHLTAAVVNGKFYAIAGRNSRDLAVVEEFDPANNTWRTRASAPTARGGLAGAAVNGRIYVMGGEGASGTPDQTFKQNEEYDPATDRWRALPDMPTPRHGIYAANVGAVIYTPSGGPRAGANFSNRTEAYVLPPTEAPAVSGGPVNAASYTPESANGLLMTVFGRNLAPGTQVATGPLPRRQLLGVRVNLGVTALALLSVTPGQISFRLGAIGGELRVSHAGVDSAPFTVPATSPARPGIFSLSMDGKGQGAILVAGTGLIARLTRDAFSQPGRRGGVVEIYGTGLGEATLGIDLLERTRLAVQAEIGGRDAEVLYSGIAPGLLGVYQVNARIPADSPVGLAVEVRLRAGGAVSNTVTMGIAE